VVFFFKNTLSLFFISEKNQTDQPFVPISFKEFIKESKQVLDRARKGAKMPQAAGASSQTFGMTPATPHLGRGFAPGTDIFLESPTKKRKSQESVWGPEESCEKSSLPGLPSNLKSMSKVTFE
jgi:hypothetical protein